jgi:PIN domain nuclease of toxin-antitoxin system
VKLLLDTQIAIWALVDRLRIGEAARELIQDGGNQVFVSVASVWEIAIKYALHKRRGAPPFSGAAAIGHFGTAGYEFLNITPEHVRATEALPPLHADPFDRLLIAQALREPMRLITADEILARYSDTIIRA